MRPLREMPDAVAARIRGFAFDIDDTITRGGLVEREAFAALWALRDAGLALVAATGRPLGWVDVIARHWPVHAAVGENGAGWVWRDGEVVREGYASSPTERAAQAALLERVRGDVAASMPDVREAGDQRARRADLAFDIGETICLPADRIAFLMDRIRASGARATRSTVHAHAIPGAWDKATGIVAAIGAALGAEEAAGAQESWIFVGDSPNDAEAFAFFRHTVGVANVGAHAAELPTPPRWVTMADRGRGFAELAARVLGARGAT